MKRVKLFFLIFVPIFVNAQVSEDFSDGNITENPVWKGDLSAFRVNEEKQLQSTATSTSVSSVFTTSESFDNASWECWVKIDYTTSSSNYVAIYLTSDKIDISAGCQGYYVQIGGTNDEVSLFLQQGTKRTKIIDGENKRTDDKTVELKIKVTRDRLGNFSLYSQKADETDYYFEGRVCDNVIREGNYFGLLYSNTSTTGSDYYFDDILVTGDKAIDSIAPEWDRFQLILPDTLFVGFDEKMNFENAYFEVNNGVGEPYEILKSEDKTGIKLIFDHDFERGIIYSLRINGITDEAGNKPDILLKNIGITEFPLSGELLWNEVMFENPAESEEYVEIFNNSEKVVDLSKVAFTTRKANQELNTLNGLSEENYYLAPHEYIAFCENPDVVGLYHNCSLESNILSIENMPALNNESATLVLTNFAADTIYDELTYNSAWHHVLITNPKGVALEKINPILPTQLASSWHSASSASNYGTPGYKNSQFMEISERISESTGDVIVEPETFSPDNDGNDDVCLIRYNLPEAGYVGKVLILTPSGVPVKSFGNSLILQSNGYFSWDGKTDRDERVNSGIYVIYFETFNAQKGNKLIKKLPIVVSYR
ncbi:MAG: hypothetical protein PHH37_12155 [Paludibacter sp.]|nr:hypothetical protein [Paludibacter sp.]